MTKAGIAILFGTAVAAITGVILSKKFSPKVDEDGTIEALKMQIEKADETIKNLKEEIAKKDEEIEALKKEIERVDTLRKCEMFVHKNNKTVIDDDMIDCPMTPDEILDFNDDHGLYGHLEYGTEEQWDYFGTDKDGEDEVVFDHLEIYFYADGKAYDENNVFVEPKYYGNLLSGMGKEDPVRYIINHETEELYKVTYVDQSSELPCPKPE